MSKPDYSKAIKHREEAIKKLQTNPPASWDKLYTARNIQIMRDQITSFQECK